MSTFKQPIYAGAGAQTGTAYPLAIDAAVEVMKREAARFAPHQNEPPDMTVFLDAGYIYNSFAGVENSVGTQQTAIFVPPVTNPRKDRIVIDVLTGLVQVVAGTESATPIPPPIPDDTAPICIVTLTVGITEITNSDIDDSAKFTNLLGFRSAAFQPMFQGTADPLTAVLGLQNIRNGAGMTYAAGGTADALTISPMPAPAGYDQNQRWIVKATATNTGPATLDVSGLGAVPLRMFGGSAALRPGDLTANMYMDVVYDSVGGVFQILSQSAQAPGGVDFQEFLNSGTWNKPPNATIVMGHIVGAGGSGGTTYSNKNGGGGGFGTFFLTAADSFAATETATVGAGVLGNGAAGDGGTSSLTTQGRSLEAFGGGGGNSAINGGSSGGGGGGLGGRGIAATPGPALAGDGKGGTAGSSSSYANTSAQPGSAERGGGGGAAGSAGIGGNSVWGGGGGVWNSAANGGRSVFGGDGGDSGAVAQVPGGGGRAGQIGADGWVRVWTI